ncbi:hypothetical protein QOZ80_8AG0628130 [Eleusine coracana subsp. coracana]|nr:hypothetical protein QOZ80_8AG0628130 [Eleusine coracana subsp. coracana]
MEVIFGNGLATEKFSMGFGEPLGSPSDFADSTLKLDNYGFKLDDVYKLFGEAPKGQDDDAGGSASGAGGSGSGNKRKGTALAEEDIIVLNGMRDVVNNVATTIRETKVEEVHPELYGAVMNVPRFTKEALMVAHSHLLDNKAQGTRFVAMTNAHRVL